MFLAITKTVFKSGNIEQLLFAKIYLYLLDSGSTSAYHILVELFENWNFHTEIGSNLYIVKKENGVILKILPEIVFD